MGKHSAVEEGVDIAPETRARVEMQYTLLQAAYSLVGDGEGGMWDHNPEYSRAIFELVSDTTGVDKEAVPELIRLVGHPEAFVIDRIIQLLRNQ